MSSKEEKLKYLNLRYVYPLFNFQVFESYIHLTMIPFDSWVAKSSDALH